MASIVIDSNVDAFMTQALGTLTRQIPYALSRAINDTGADVLAMVPDMMESVFDRPTPYAKGAFMLYKSDKGNLSATVMRKPDAMRRRFLEVEATGGPRDASGYEGRMRELANPAYHRSTMGVGSNTTGLEKLRHVESYPRDGYGWIFAIPIKEGGARLDQYGNLSRGQLNQILSDLRVSSDPYSYSTKESRKKAGRPNTFYFIPKNFGGHPGVYQRSGKGKHEKLSLVLSFVDSLKSYTPRFPFQAKAAETAKAVFPGHFAARFSEAIASAR